jgi:catechol 2,3-dioxygenase-like lactoylglutathione lyase family enzyme
MPGLHHVTAIAGQASQNFSFYTKVLGLRLVKKTVNFDDPGTYHLYYGDERGHPGTILTFFPWEHAAPGRGGTGLTHQTAFKVPLTPSVIGRTVAEKGTDPRPLVLRFGESVLGCRPTDRLSAGIAGGSRPGWSDGEIAAEHAIRLSRCHAVAYRGGADRRDSQASLALKQVGTPRLFVIALPTPTKALWSISIRRMAFLPEARIGALYCLRAADEASRPRWQSSW